MNVIDLARRSIRFRLWILLVAMSMAILAISVIIFGLYGWHSRQQQSETHLVSMAEMIALNSAAPLLFHDDETARDDLKQIKNHKDIMYVGIVDAQGRIFAEQGICINRSPDTWNRNHAAVHCRKNARLCATAPIVNQNDTIGYVHIEQELTQLNRQIATFAASALGIFLFTLLVAMALSNRIGRTITEPITHLAAMIRQVSDSRRIGSPIFVTSQDEIGDLSRGIHVMLKNLDVSRQALEKSLSLQQTLFDTIPMPVYGKNNERRFTAMNHPFAHEVIGKPPGTILGSMQEDYPNNFDAETTDLFRRREILLLLTGQEQAFEVIGRDASGQPKIYHIRLGIHRDAEGHTVGLMGVMQDITEIRRIGRELIDVSMREQQRLARDLHDNLGQLLTATACKIKLLDYEIDDKQTEIKTSLADIIDLVNRAARETRALSHGLNPVDIERGGLVSALKELADSTVIYARMNCRFTTDHNLPELSKEISNQLYRIAQEAVSNAVRHADAKSIDIHLAHELGVVVLTITDDGSGLPTDQENTASGMGIRIMNQRALMINGTLECRNREDKGTEVVCRCPITPAGG